MRYFILALFFSPLFVFAQGDEDCRMNESDLKPIISRFNPFFIEHTWDNQEKIEVARLDDNRLVTIRQKACLRHHIMISLLIDASEIENENRFWITEVLVLMKRIFYEDPEYPKFKRMFEIEFIKTFLANGTNVMFNFPLGERSIICKIEHGEWGARIKLELVRFILKEKIRRPGVTRDKDDGWFRDGALHPPPGLNVNRNP